MQRPNRPYRRSCAAMFAAMAVTGCLGRRVAVPATSVETQSFGAELAHVSVVNHTPYRLTIAFRPAAGPGREVSIGSIESGGRRRLAPVPAGEAIILIARAAGIGELVLDPRSFALDQHWEWDIPADAHFRGAAPPGYPAGR